LPNQLIAGCCIDHLSWHLLPVHLDFQAEALSPLLYFIPLSLAVNQCGTKVIQLVVQCGQLIHKIVFYLASAG